MTKQRIKPAVGQKWRRKPDGYLYRVASEGLHGYWNLVCLTGGGRDTAVQELGLNSKFELVEEAVTGPAGPHTVPVYETPDFPAIRERLRRNRIRAEASLLSTEDALETMADLEQVMQLCESLLGPVGESGGALGTNQAVDVLMNFAGRIEKDKSIQGLARVTFATRIRAEAARLRAETGS